MAEANQIENLLNNLAECAICLSDVTNHRVLPCQHLFCQTCLEPIVKDNSISCPVCRKSCPMRGQAVDTLPRSLLLMNILDKLCEICKQKSRDIHCPHCAKWMCSVCHENCREEIEHTLKSLRNKTDKQMIKGQRHIKSLCDEMYRINTEVTEISESIDTNVDLAIGQLHRIIEEINTKRKIMKKDMQVQRTDTFDMLQASYNISVDKSAKLADFGEQYASFNQNDDNVEALTNLCRKWEDYLAASGESALSSPALQQPFPVKDLTINHESDHAGVHVRIVIPYQKSDTEEPLSNAMVKLDSEVDSHLCAAEDTNPDTNHNTAGPQGESQLDDVLVISSSDPGHADFVGSTQVSSRAQSDPLSHFTDNTDMSAPHVLPGRVLSPAPVPTVYAEMSKPRAVFGSIGSGVKHLHKPSFVALSPVTGNIFVTDVNNYRVQVLDEQGQFLGRFGSRGSNVGQFDFESDHFEGGISATADGNIVVADTNNNRIQMFDEHGSFIKAFGSRGSRQGQLLTPVGVAVGPTGDIYVCDFGNGRIQVFNCSGRAIRVFGTVSRMGGWKPYDITLTNNGTVIVADGGETDNGKLEIFSRNGQHMETIRYAGINQIQRPLAVTVDVNDNIIVTDSGTDKVHILRESGEHIKTFGFYGKAPGQFNNPCGVACTRDGRIIVVDEGNNRIQLF